jgi:hypothetical protein
MDDESDTMSEHYIEDLDESDDVELERRENPKITTEPSHWYEL